MALERARRLFLERDWEPKAKRLAESTATEATRILTESVERCIGKKPDEGEKKGWREAESRLRQKLNSILSAWFRAEYPKVWELANKKAFRNTDSRARHPYLELQAFVFLYPALLKYFKNKSTIAPATFLADWKDDITPDYLGKLSTVFLASMLNTVSAPAERTETVLGALFERTAHWADERQKFYAPLRKPRSDS